MVMSRQNVILSPAAHSSLTGVSGSLEASLPTFRLT
ncbi:hypothetical protein E2C01_094190 [Portunus trituberculatus]|uniref:Uncharacterized protein n=1 Tax=Portunus trituberculatus TaxID=210409 RepID=A0A5B7K055_PORTR|nr:hypothetical protein [Portunus trituberculatus]